MPTLSRPSVHIVYDSNYISFYTRKGINVTKRRKYYEELPKRVVLASVHLHAFEGCEDAPSDDESLRNKKSDEKVQEPTKFAQCVHAVQLQTQYSTAPPPLLGGLGLGLGLAPRECFFHSLVGRNVVGVARHTTMVECDNLRCSNVKEDSLA